MDELLNFLVKSLVSDEKAVEVSKEEDDKAITYKVKVAAEDVGKVIGKSGKTANSIRTVLKSVGAKTHKKVFVKFGE